MQVRRLKILFLALSSVGLFSCTVLQRSPGSGYNLDQRSRQMQGGASTHSIHKQFYIEAANQLGMYYEHAVQNSESYYQLRQRAEILQRERSLASTPEKQQYYYYRPWLETDEEALHFLRLPGFQARQNWIHRNGVERRRNIASGVMHEIVNDGDIAYGMQMELVQKAWGEPTRKEVSGDPILRNQKWIYTKYIPSPEGYQLERKSVVFDNGQVVGWTMD